MPLEPAFHGPPDVLTEKFGFDCFRAGQEQVVDALLAGRSALAVFPTGAGKSLCYQLPALLLEGMTIVVSPLIALMKDQIDFLQRSGIDAARLDSSLDAAEQREIFERLRAGALKLLYVAPERFNNERFLAQLARARISLFAVDEAHCISEWGHNFRPDYLKLAERARELDAERVLALTATATPAVVADIRAGFGIEEVDSVVTGFYRPNLILLTTPVSAGERDGRLVERLRERPPGSTIVYVTLQRTSSRRSRSGWESTRPTSATSTTTTCRRASSPIRRRSGAPGVTARRASASCSLVRRTCQRSRTSPSATRPRARRSAACLLMFSSI